ncbi:MAG: RdgB/HAM1 family non-canonical purine NTP pyrophosphatase [Jiangellaceae bacterium]
MSAAGRRRVVLATRNPHKVGELRRILADVGVSGIDLVSLADFSDVPDVAETGQTFAENAVLKATAVAVATQLCAIADDSGLSVDALSGMPGVLSARWAGRHGDDTANLALVLGQLADVPDDRRAAAFVCVAAMALPSGSVVVEEGQVRGRLATEPRGTNGFGYDPIFVPDGDTRTMAELPPGDKDAISHRGRAFRALIPHLLKLA